MEALWRAVFLMIAAASMAEKALADQRHVVGGTQGWQESIDFDSWASAQTFKVGDQLGIIPFFHSTFFDFTSYQ